MDCNMENTRVKNLLLEDFLKKKKDICLSQAEISRLTGITPPRASDLVNGKTEKFSLDAMVNIAAKLGITLQLK